MTKCPAIGRFGVRNWPGCTSAGQTEDEAMANIREAIELYLEPDAYPLAPTAITREVVV